MKKKFLSILSILLLASIAVVSLAWSPASNALAQSNPQETVNDLLSQAFAAEQTWLSKQQTAIDKADLAANKVQEIIDRAAAKGLDVTVLETALAAFQAAMATVKSDHQTAADILATHAGFDSNGVVTDRPTARQTVMDARRALGTAHMTMTQAFWDLRDAVRAWKDANFPK